MNSTIGIFHFHEFKDKVTQKIRKKIRISRVEYFRFYLSSKELNWGKWNVERKRK